LVPPTPRLRAMLGQAMPQAQIDLQAKAAVDCLLAATVGRAVGAAKA
jgi:hypothetical protein